MPDRVQDHYGATDLVQRILAAADVTDGAAVTADRFFPYDQLHGRELRATQDHAAKLNPARSAHLLDVGAGIGGPARYFASVFGCRVTGIDLTPQFVVAARALSRLCQLEHAVDFVEADAAAIPFDTGRFDHAYCFYVGMNLPDKPAVMRNVFRVLKPGALLLWTEVTRKSGDPHYPLPWARQAVDSHLDTVEALSGHLAQAGFEIMSVEDETDLHLDLARRMRASGARPPDGQVQANEVVLGADFQARRVNYIQSLADGALSSTVILARKGPDPVAR